MKLWASLTSNLKCYVDKKNTASFDIGLISGCEMQFSGIQIPSHPEWYSMYMSALRNVLINGGAWESQPNTFQVEVFTESKHPIDLGKSVP